MKVSRSNNLWTKPAFRVLFSKWGFLCLCLIVVMQLIVASSTIWLVQLIHVVQSQKPFWVPLGLYLVSLLLPYFPGGGALLVISHWQMAALNKFVDAFVVLHQNRQGLWTSKIERERRISLLTAEGQQSYSLFIEFLHRLFCCALNVTLNLAVLSYLVEWKFLLGYGLSLLSSFLLLRMFNQKQIRLAIQAQNARVELGQTLMNGWDNILLGNTYNFDIWRGLFVSRFQKASRANIHSACYRQVLSVVLALLTLAPCFLIVAQSMWVHRMDLMVLSSFVVTLPRLFLILGFTHELVDLFSEWNIQKSRLVGINNILTSNEDIALDERIQFDILQFFIGGSEYKIQRMDDLWQRLTKPGRITLRGSNGSGKSSLLVLLKENLKERAYYLPTEIHLSFQGDGAHLSTGQDLKQKLLEISDKIDLNILLLDEWDANLDPSNQLEISNQIDQLASRKCILEIRHRQ